MLCALSLVFLRLSLLRDPFTPWVSRDDPRLRVAVLLMPFAGLAFLWLLGVVRYRIVEEEGGRYDEIVPAESIVHILVWSSSRALGACPRFTNRSFSRTGTDRLSLTSAATATSDG